VARALRDCTPTGGEDADGFGLRVLGDQKKGEKIMANKNIFKSIKGMLLPATDVVNDERAPAYAFTPKHALAQYAATGCLNSTFYANAEDQLAKVIELCREVDADFIARTAVYTREQGFMKDMPALLCAVLSVKEPALLARVFSRVIDNGKMPQLRSDHALGRRGRKSLGTAPKRLVRDWFESRSEEVVFTASVGQAVVCRHSQDGSSEAENGCARGALRLFHRARVRRGCIA
jgi:60 kDa SS-A/Ro ribonucleoprotein